MKKINKAALFAISLAIILLSGCSKDGPEPDTPVSSIILRLNGINLTGSNFHIDGKNLFMDFPKDNMQIGIFPTSLSIGSRFTVGPSSSLKFIVYYRLTNKTFISDSTQGSGELYIEQNHITSKSVTLTDFFTGEKYDAKKLTIKMKGGFRFRAIAADKDSVIAENGIFDATEISYIR